MFTLQIVFILLFGNQVGFLTNHFTDGKLLCQRDEITYIYEADRPKTFHTFKLPEGEGWKCQIYVCGSGYLFPSERDFVIRKLEFKDSSLLTK